MRTIDYGKLMHRAMRSLIQEVLSDVRDSGLPGLHHFFIKFETTYPGVQVADWLKERYPNEMTVVMQHWFEDLTVTDDGFSVTLNFGDTPENLTIPYDAIQTFVDPSVEFGLRFEAQEDEDEDPDVVEHGTTVALPELEARENVPAPGVAKDAKSKGDVVSLDSFRK